MPSSVSGERKALIVSSRARPIRSASIPSGTLQIRTISAPVAFSRPIVS